jgi:hypothetical protein
MRLKKGILFARNGIRCWNAMYVLCGHFASIPRGVAEERINREEGRIFSGLKRCESRAGGQANRGLAAHNTGRN